MQAIVTGASGFLGGFLIRALMAHGVSITGVARSAIAGLPVVRVADYADTPAGDVLIHLAETRDRTAAQDAGHGYVETAVATLERLIAKGYRKVIYVSSALVYGNDSLTPHRATDPVHATDVYSRAKLACEKRVLESGGLVSRLSNLYGPGMATNNVVSTILDQIPGKGPVRVWDDKPVRDFLWVEDAALALLAMINSERSGIYNVGTHVGVSIGDLARLALSLAGQPDRPVVATRSSQLPSFNIVDITETVEHMSWRPHTMLNDGIRALLKGKQPSKDKT